MKNIQVIDGSVNCVFDVFSATSDEFEKIFPNGTNIAFIDEVYATRDAAELDAIFEKVWAHPVRKCEANGIHGILFYELEEKKAYYPTRIDEEAINPDGSRLR